MNHTMTCRHFAQAATAGIMKKFLDVP